MTCVIELLVNRLMVLVDNCWLQNTSYVVVLRICRSPSYVVVIEIPPRLFQHMFNAAATLVNELLSYRCTTRPNTYFLCHTRNNFNTRFLTEFVSEDGIHMDRLNGIATYFMLLRGTVLLAERHVRIFIHYIHHISEYTF